MGFDSGVSMGCVKSRVQVLGRVDYCVREIQVGSNIITLLRALCASCIER